MSKLYATLPTDNEIIEWLKQYSEEVYECGTLNGRLYIDVWFMAEKDVKKDIKYFLRKSGFVSSMGCAQRKCITEKVRGENFNPSFLN